MNFLKIILGLLFILVVGCSAISGNAFYIKSPITPGNDCLVKDASGNNWEFSASDPFTDNVVAIANYQEPDKSLKGIVSATLPTLSVEDYDTMKEMEDEGSCPAKFLNKAATMNMIITDKAEVARKLKSIKKGSKLNLDGYYVDFAVTTPDGHDVDFSVGHNINFIYVNRLKITR